MSMSAASHLSEDQKCSIDQAITIDAPDSFKDGLDLPVDDDSNGEDENAFETFLDDYKYLMLQPNGQPTTAGVKQPQTIVENSVSSRSYQQTSTKVDQSQSFTEIWTQKVKNQFLTPHTKRNQTSLLTKREAQQVKGGSSFWPQVDIWGWVQSQPQHTDQETQTDYQVDQLEEEVTLSEQLVGSWPTSHSRRQSDDIDTDDDTISVYSEASTSLYFDATSPICSPPASFCSQKSDTSKNLQDLDDTINDRVTNTSFPTIEILPVQNPTNSEVENRLQSNIAEYPTTSSSEAIVKLDCNLSLDPAGGETTPINCNQHANSPESLHSQSKKKFKQHQESEQLQFPNSLPMPIFFGQSGIARNYQSGEAVFQQETRNKFPLTEKVCENSRKVLTKSSSILQDQRKKIIFKSPPKEQVEGATRPRRFQRRKPGSPMRKRTESHDKFLAKKMTVEQSSSPSLQNTADMHDFGLHTPSLLSEKTNYGQETKLEDSDTCSHLRVKERETLSVKREFTKSVEYQQLKTSSVSEGSAETKQMSASESTYSKESVSVHISVRGKRTRDTQSFHNLQAALTRDIKDLIKQNGQRKEGRPHNKCPTCASSPRTDTDLTGGLSDDNTSALFSQSISSMSERSLVTESEQLSSTSHAGVWQTNTNSYSASSRRHHTHRQKASCSESASQQRLLRSSRTRGQCTAGSIDSRETRSNISSVFDVRRFDTILDHIFPLTDPTTVNEVHEPNQCARDGNTPDELFMQNTPPSILYSDKMEAIRLSHQLHTDLLSMTSPDTVLPSEVPFLLSYQFQYVRNDKGRYIDLGWSGNSKVYLAHDKVSNGYVAVKIKNRMKAANEARILQFLVGVDNIPTFYGALAMVDKNLLGLVCELVTNGTNRQSLRSKDIGAFLTLEKRRALLQGLYLTPYQWLDICIAVSKIITSLHERGVIANDITMNNFLLRLEGHIWVPYIADLSQACRNARSKSFLKRLLPLELTESNKHWAPETLAGHSPTEFSDVYSLGYMVNHIYAVVRLPPNTITSKAMSRNIWERPKAKQFMNGLIKQRSTLTIPGQRC